MFYYGILKQRYRYAIVIMTLIIHNVLYYCGNTVRHHFGPAGPL